MKKAIVLAAAVALTAPALALTWDSVPMAGGDQPDDLRSWMMTDPVTGDVFYSKWANGGYDVYRLDASKATDYGVTTAGDWATYAQPRNPDTSPMYTGNWDSGTGFNIYDGYLYAGTSHTARDAAGNPWDRQLVRLDVAGAGEGDWTTQYRVGDGANFAGAAYDNPANPGQIKITAKWTGWTHFKDYDVTAESGADFSYSEVADAGGAPGYWGSDSVVGSNGMLYYIEPGSNGNAYQLRKGSLSSTTLAADLGTPWVDIAAFPTNNDHNRRTNTAIEFVPAADSLSGLDELWVMPMNLDGVQTDKIYRLSAADGSLLGEELLPFVLDSDLGFGYDMAYADGVIYLMEGRTHDTLWSAAVPEPASLVLLALAGALIRRR